MRIAWICVLAGLALSGCGSSSSGGSGAVDEYYGTTVTLPNGKRILAESVRSETMMMRGMMFRDSLAEDRGMLFTHGGEGNFPYWMFQVRIPLDILWMDRQGRIVEIVEGAAPCPAKPCGGYGGKAKALYVLELAGGSVKKQGLREGDRLQF